MEETKASPDGFDVALEIQEFRIVSVDGSQSPFAFNLELIKVRRNFESISDERGQFAGYTFHEFEEVDLTSVEFPLESTIGFRDATTTGVYTVAGDSNVLFERITAENTERVFTPPQPSSGDAGGD